MKILTDYLNTDNLIPLLIGTWVVLGLFSAAFFRFNNNPLLKKIVLATSVIITGGLFIAIGWFVGFRGTAFFVMVIATLGISILNITRTTFCALCGRTLHNQSPFEKNRKCVSCEKSSVETPTS